MRLTVDVFLACVAFLLLCAITIHAPFSPFAAKRLENRLAEKTLELVTAEPWSTITVEGQKAIISGKAPSDEALFGIIEKVTQSSGAGGIIWGGITVADASTVRVHPPDPVITPYTLRIRINPSTIDFSGFVPDQSMRDEVFDTVLQHLTEREITGALEIGRAGFDTQIWRSELLGLLPSLALLKDGELSASEQMISLVGNVDDEEAAIRLNDLIASLPDGLRSTANLTITSPPQLPDENLIEQLIKASDQDTSEKVQQIPSEPEVRDGDVSILCRNAVDSAFNQAGISFLSARSEIDQQSRNMLDDLATTLKKCPTISFEIIGHTDSIGTEASNRTLSLYRADAVKAYLGALGVSGNRMKTSGAGESQSIASNSTAVGRRTNRRIEFRIAD